MAARSKKHFARVVRAAVLLERLAVKHQRILQDRAALLIKGFLKSATRGENIRAVMSVVRDRVVRIQRWWKHCFLCHVRRYARLRLVWARAERSLSRRALMVEVSKRLYALHETPNDIRSLAFLPVPDVSSRLGLSWHKAPTASAAAGFHSPKPRTCSRSFQEREEWDALGADALALVAMRAQHHREQQAGERDSDVRKTLAEQQWPSEPAATRARKKPSKPQETCQGDGSLANAARALTASSMHVAVVHSAAGKYVQDKLDARRLQTVAEMGEEEVSRYWQTGDGWRALFSVLEQHLCVGEVMRARVLRHRLGALQDKYIFMRKRTAAAHATWQAAQRLLEDGRHKVAMYKSGAWMTEMAEDRAQTQTVMAGDAQSKRGAGKETSSSLEGESENRTHEPQPPVSCRSSSEIMRLRQFRCLSMSTSKKGTRESGRAEKDVMCSPREATGNRMERAGITLSKSDVASRRDSESDEIESESEDGSRISEVIKVCVERILSGACGNECSRDAERF